MLGRWTMINPTHKFHQNPHLDGALQVCTCHRPFYQADADRLKYTEQRVAELEAEVAELRHGAS